jgi:hypothetical protein
VGGLVELRDRARRVLQSQNEGWPEAHRDDARRQLNWAYDRFVTSYGPMGTDDGSTWNRSAANAWMSLAGIHVDDLLLGLAIE